MYIKQVKILKTIWVDKCIWGKTGIIQHKRSHTVNNNIKEYLIKLNNNFKNDITYIWLRKDMFNIISRKNSNKINSFLYFCEFYPGICCYQAGHCGLYCGYNNLCEYKKCDILSN